MKIDAYIYLDTLQELFEATNDEKYAKMAANCILGGFRPDLN